MLKRILSNVILIVSAFLVTVAFASNSINKTKLLEIEDNGLQGLIDLSGKVIVHPKYKKIGVYNEGLAPVLIGDRWGYINNKDKLQIKAIYNEARPFLNGLAGVKIDNKWGAINNKGAFVIKPQYDSLDMFIDGYATASINGKYGLIDKKGNIIIDFIYDKKLSFFEGLANVEIKGSKAYGFINRNNEVIFKLNTGIYPLIFSEGLASASILVDDSLKNHKSAYGYINKNGAFVIKPDFEEANPFNDGYAAVKLNDHWGFIDKTGQFVIKPHYEDVEYRFSEGLACVKINNKFGYIDIHDNLVLKPIYDTCSSFRDGVAWVEYLGVSTYINKQGKLLWTPEILKAKIEIERKNNTKSAKELAREGVDKYLKGLSMYELREGKKIVADTSWPYLQDPSINKYETVYDEMFDTDIPVIKGYKRLIYAQVNNDAGITLNKRYVVIAYADTKDKKWRVFDIFPATDPDEAVAFAKKRLELEENEGNYFQFGYWSASAGKLKDAHDACNKALELHIKNSSYSRNEDSAAFIHLTTLKRIIGN